MSAAFQEGPQPRDGDVDVLASIRRMIAHGPDSGAGIGTAADTGTGAAPLRLQPSDVLGGSNDAAGTRAAALRWAMGGQAQQAQRTPALGAEVMGDAATAVEAPRALSLIQVPATAAIELADAEILEAAPSAAEPLEPVNPASAEPIEAGQPIEIRHQQEELAMTKGDENQSAIAGGESIIGTIFRDILRQELSGQGSDVLRRQMRDMILREVIQAISTPARSA